MGNIASTSLYQELRTASACFTQVVIADLWNGNNDNDLSSLLHTPLDGFPFRYYPLAIARIAELTNGNPYLVQLVGWHVYDQFTRKQNQKRSSKIEGREKPYDPLFTVSNVQDAIVRPLCIEGQKYFYRRLLWSFNEEDQDTVDEILDLFRGSPRLRKQEIVDFICPTKSNSTTPPYSASTQNSNPKPEDVIELIDRLTSHGVLSKPDPMITLKMDILAISHLTKPCRGGTLLDLTCFSSAYVLMLHIASCSPLEWVPSYWSICRILQYMGTTPWKI